jgi:hypothetical protein
MNTDKVKETVNEVVAHAEKVVEHGTKLAENPKAIGVAIGSAVNKFGNVFGSLKSIGSFTKSFARSVADGYNEARTIKVEKAKEQNQDKEAI